MVVMMSEWQSSEADNLQAPGGVVVASVGDSS